MPRIWQTPDEPDIPRVTDRDGITWTKTDRLVPYPFDSDTHYWRHPEPQFNGEPVDFSWGLLVRTFGPLTEPDRVNEGPGPVHVFDAESFATKGEPTVRVVEVGESFPADAVYYRPSEVDA